MRKSAQPILIPAEKIQILDSCLELVRDLCVRSIRKGTEVGGPIDQIKSACDAVLMARSKYKTAAAFRKALDRP
jgi:hypothetical protein